MWKSSLKVKFSNNLHSHLFFPLRLNFAKVEDFHFSNAFFDIIDKNNGVTLNGVGFRAVSPFIESFKGIFSRMISNGLAQKFIGDYWNRQGFNRGEDQIGPQVLTLDDLGVAFQICCILLALSLAAFAGEIFVFWSKQLGKAIRQRLISSAIVIAFCDK